MFSGTAGREESEGRSEGPQWNCEQILRYRSIIGRSLRGRSHCFWSGRFWSDFGPILPITKILVVTLQHWPESILVRTKIGPKAKAKSSKSKIGGGGICLDFAFGPNIFLELYIVFCCYLFRIFFVSLIPFLIQFLIIVASSLQIFQRVRHSRKLILCSDMAQIAANEKEHVTLIV